jgi:hypothetical protein
MNLYPNIERTLETQKQENSPIKKWSKDLIRHLTKEYAEMASKHLLLGNHKLNNIDIQTRMAKPQDQQHQLMVRLGSIAAPTCQQGAHSSCTEGQLLPKPTIALPDGTEILCPRWTCIQMFILPLFLIANCESNKDALH